MRLPGIALLVLITAIPLAADDDTENLNLEKDPRATVHHGDNEVSTSMATNTSIDAASAVDEETEEISHNQSDHTGESIAIDDDGRDQDAENDLVDEGTNKLQAQHEQIEEASPRGKDATDNNDDPDMIESELVDESLQQNMKEDPDTDDGKHANVSSTTASAAAAAARQERNAEFEAGDDSAANADPASTPPEKNDIDVVTENHPPTEKPEDPEVIKPPKDTEEGRKPVLVDYANKSTGALIVDKSRNFQGTSNLLASDKDKYAMIPCNDEEVKFVIIGLSEDILVKTIKLSNYEKFSSRTKRFQVMGSQTYPIMTEWESFGVFDAKPWYKENQEQTFELEVPSWARYLKFRFLDHYGDEHYCTATQIKVHGSTTLQGFHEMQLEKETLNEAEEIQGQAHENTEPSTEIKSKMEGVESSNPSETGEAEVESAQNQAESESAESGADQKEETTRAVSSDTTDINHAKTDELIDESSGGAPDDVRKIESNESTKVSHADVVDDKNASIGDNDQIHDVRKRNESRTESSVEGGDSNIENATLDANVDSQIDTNASVSSERTGDHKDQIIHPPGTSDEKIADDAGDPDTITEDRSNDGTSDPSASPTVLNAVNSAIQSAKKAAGVKDTVTGTRDQIPIGDSTEGDGSHEDVNVDTVESDGLSMEENEDADIAQESSRKETAERSDDVDSGAIVIDEGAQAHGSGDISTPSLTEDAPTPDKTNKTLPSKTYEDLVTQLSTSHTNLACLDSLNFQEYKENAIRKATEKKKKGTTGSLSSQKNEPLFQTLTNEIKNLETRQRVYEQYIEVATNCYQQVIFDLGIELMMVNKQQEQRFDLLEEQMRRLQEAEEKRRPLTVGDIVATIKDFAAQAIIFANQCFPVLTLWCMYFYNFIDFLLERILANERVQMLLSIAVSYKRDLKTFMLGALFCYLYVKLTKVKERKEPDTTTKRRRKDRRKKMKGKGSFPDVAAVSGGTHQSTLSLRTDEDSDS